MINLVFNRKSLFTKLVVCGFLGALGIQDLHSVQSGPVVADSKSSEGEQQDGDDAASNDSGVSLSDFGGFYFGLGLSWQNFKRKVTVSDNLLSHQPGANLGIFAQKDKKDALLVDKSKGAFGGSVLAGYCWQLNRHLCVALEAVLDFAGNCKSTQDADFSYKDSQASNGIVEDIWRSNVKTRSVVPTFSVRIGGIVPVIDCLLYIKGGISYLKSELSADYLIANEAGDEELFKISKVVPVLGIGIEKKIFKPSKGDLALRFEWEHRFEAKKSWNYNDYAKTGYKATPRIKLRGDVVRVLLVYRFGK